MATPGKYLNQLIKNVEHLTPNQLKEVIDFTSSFNKKQTEKQKNNGRKIVKLGGLWKGLKISEKHIHQARKQTLNKLENLKLL